MIRELARALESSPEPLQAGQLTRLLGPVARASAVEAARAKAKQLVVRGVGGAGRPGPVTAQPGRYRPSDQVLAFLDRL